MKKNVRLKLSAILTPGLHSLFWFFLALNTAKAAELQSLEWDNTDPATLKIHVTGQPAYDVQTLEDGQRLRLRLQATTLAPSAGDIDGRGKVKGVYPYLADNGTAVYIDLLVSEPSQLQVKSTADGYRAVVQPATAANTAPTAAATPAVATEAPAINATASAPDASNYLEAITYNKLPGDRLQIQFKTAKRPETPNAFTTNSPARISLDFPNTGLHLAQKNIPIGIGAVVSVVAVAADTRTRVVLNLVKPAGYTSHIDDNGLTLIVENPVENIGAVPVKTTQFAVATKGGRHTLKDIDFRRGPGGDGKIIMTLSDPGIGISISELGGEIYVDFIDTSISQELQRRLDVVDFATPIQTIDTFAQGDNVRMVIKPKGRYEQSAYQADNSFTIDVKPVVVKPGEEKKADEFGYTGDKLSLNFQNIDVRAALQVIADFTGINFVTSDTVKGSLTLRLKDVPWDQALDVILSSKNLAMRHKGNVITVAPAEEVAAKEKLELESTKQVLDLEPLVSELVQINYAKADDVAALLKSVKAVSGGGVPQNPGAYSNVSISKIETESNSLLSPRGQVTVDERTNTLLIQDTPGKISEVRKLIEKLDKPVRQVMIETRLVEASDGFNKSLGVKLGASNANHVTGQESISQGATIGPSLLNSSGLNVNLPSPGIGGTPAGSIALTIAKFGTNNNLLSLELSALEAENKGKVIASPRLITANQKKAHIEQGVETLVVTTAPTVPGAAPTAPTVTKVKAVLSLDVTPQITPDDRVIMDVEIRKDDFINVVTGTLNTKMINTQVLLDNGETVVIGGIYTSNENTTTNKIPFFGSIPVLGWLFKNKTDATARDELLIFLTPRILSSTLNLK